MEWANRSTWCEGSRCLRLGIDRRWVPVHRGSISPRALESQRLCKLTRSTVRWLWPNRWVLLRCQVPEPITISQCYPTVIGPLYCDRTSHWLCDCLFQSVRDLNSLSKPSWHFSLSTSPILLLPLRLYFLFLFLRLLLLVALFFWLFVSTLWSRVHWFISSIFHIILPVLFNKLSLLPPTPIIMPCYS